LIDNQRDYIIHLQQFDFLISMMSNNCKGTNLDVAHPDEGQGFEYHFKDEHVEVAELMENGPKRGHKCCGGCCDVRRAVIIVNIISSAVLLITIWSTVAGKIMSQTMVLDDDKAQQGIDSVAVTPIWPIIALLAVITVVHILGVVGAIFYQTWMVAISALGYFVPMIVGLIQLNPFYVIFNTLFFYPHYFLIKEVRQEIMTKENYHNEKMSCCCV
jgi:hypothetical protein